MTTSTNSRATILEEKLALGGIEFVVDAVLILKQQS